MRTTIEALVYALSSLQNGLATAIDVGCRRVGLLKKLERGRMFNDPPLLKKNNFVGEATSLSHIVGHQDDLRPTPMRGENQLFNRLDGSRVQTDGRLVEQQYIRLKDQGARNGDTLLLTLGEDPSRAVHEVREAGKFQDVPQTLLSFGSCVPAQLEREAQVGSHRPPQ